MFPGTLRVLLDYFYEYSTANKHKSLFNATHIPFDVKYSMTYTHKHSSKKVESMSLMSLSHLL
jgi:hypothetical protein